jgi:diguanylate cyclase (GGDEF)-like protein
MTRFLKLRVFALAGAALLAFHVAHDVIGFGGPAFKSAFALWFQPAVYLACGVVTIGRAISVREERVPWSMLGTGLVLYAAGSVYYNLVFGADGTPPFPSVADGLWLALYPLAFGAIAVLVRRRFMHVGAIVWLDGVIGGAVVSALAATVVFQPVFEITVADGAASVARLAYPLGDLVPVGFAVVVWSLSGRRFEPFWALLGGGFALLAAVDGLYVVQAANGTWAPGGWMDLPYTLATMLLAGAAWVAPRDVRPAPDAHPTRVALPVAFGLTAVGLTTYALVAGLNPVATALIVVTLLAVVLRLAYTLSWLTRQRIDLKALAATDPLTGLANHRTVHERLAEEVDRGRRAGLPVSVVALDLDHFKAINDTFGHSEGDAALQAIAAALTHEARTYDLVGRVGGEEFALLLPDAGPDEAFAIAERCRAALSRLSVQGVAVSSSAGVASYPADDPNGSRLLELADGALYWAKRSGRGQTKRFDPREVILLSGAEQLAQVRTLLESDDALTPVFQPIVELATGRIGGYEALTRFLRTEPVRTPDLWFAQARRCGLGGALEAKALAAALAVPGRPAGTFLSLNLSPAALLSREVAAVLPDDLSEIVIELTEDELFSSDDALDVELDALRARGARIAVDDAGAGYSGLQQVIRVKPEILKLDRSLIHGLHADASRIALLEALSRFAVTTGAAVCGEGIEQVEELRTLARFDVTYAQGYALGKPAPAWPAIAADVAGEVAATVSMGMRLARGPAADNGPVGLGEVTERISRLRSWADFDEAMDLIARLVHGDEVAVSRVLAGERCVETLSAHEWGSPGARFSYEDYPTTEHVIAEQVLGQLVEGDPAADPAELRLLAEMGYRVVLLAPIVFGGETVGLLEVYRVTARPWTETEIDQARVVAHHLGAALEVHLPAPAEVPGVPGGVDAMTLDPGSVHAAGGDAQPA